MESKVLAFTRDEGVGNLPDPLLNPLLNPTLGQNLGRWADVYYSSPPERREQALLDLLHELESVRKASPDEDEKVSPASDSNTLPGMLRNECLTCPECAHLISPQQRFCGVCGVALAKGAEHHIAAPAPLPTLPSIETNADDHRYWGRENNLSLDDDIHDRSRSWKYVAMIITACLVLGSYWLWRIHSQTPQPEIAGRIEKSLPTIAKQAIAPLPSDTPPAQAEIVRKFPTPAISNSLKKPKPAAGKPFGCRDDHLGKCSLAELRGRVMNLANSIDAPFVDYDRRIRQFRRAAQAHRNDSAKQKLLRQGNYSAQLWEKVQLRAYVRNQKNDAIKYRAELMRRMGRRSENSKLLEEAYKNPRLCLELHYVAEDLRRLAAKLPKSERASPVLTVSTF